MKHAIIDTENTGLFDFKLPADAPGQPRLASFGAVVLNEDLTIAEEREFFVKPEGWEMTPGAFAIHGMSTEFLLENGRPVAEVLDYYVGLIELGYVIGAYNAQHDLKQMRAELRRAGRPDLFETTPNICLMRPCTPFCQVPKPKGGGYKWPKLKEACDHFGIHQPEGTAHGALPDARSAHFVMLELAKLGAVPEAEVHFAKAKPQAF